MQRVRVSIARFAQLRVRGPAFELFCALLPASIAYRLLLIAHLSRDPITPFSFVPVFHNETAIVRCFALDWAFVASLCLVLHGFGALLARSAPERARRGLRALGWLVVYVLALLVGVDNAAHLRSLLAIHRGVDASALLDALISPANSGWIGFAHVEDLALALLPLALLIAMTRMPARLARTRARIMLALSLASLLAYLPYFANARLQLPVPRLHRELRWTPAFYAGEALFRHYTATPGQYQQRARALPRLASYGLALAPPVVRPATDRAHERAAPLRYNVVLIIMESTGSRYVFDTRRGNPVPMPRLQALMDQGLRLDRHYSASNTSPRAIFSLYTGLYPPPTDAVYVTRPDVRVPGFVSWLGPGYDTFLVTPGPLQFYMPHALIEHDGMREIYGLENLNIPPSPAIPAQLGREEQPTVDFFLKRMHRAHEPFFATYYSFAPHFDYYDQGESFRILHDLSSPRARYYNNLRLLDTQIGRIVDQLTRDGQLDHTVLVIVGDHGEAFEQHADNVAHAQESFEENLRTPALFYQPKLFAPARISVPTSHVDLLPTLLDALSIPYDPRRMQGVSLLAGAPARKYVYAWGEEGTLTSIDAQLRKLQVSFKRDHCGYYELKEDFMERSERACTGAVQAQLDNLLQFSRFQPAAVARYNDSLPRTAR